MKYLKRFNEELRPSTYMSASRKLQKMGHTDRASELKDWAIKVEHKESLVKWKENIGEYSKFGEFKLNIKNPETDEYITGDFYLFINFDDDVFQDDPDAGLAFFIGLIPKSEELINEYMNLCEDSDFGNGFFWAKIFNLEYIIDDSEIKFENWNFWDYDPNMNGEITFADRQSANKFKKLMIKITTDPDLKFPSSYTDHSEMWDKLTASIMGEAAWASDYGFELGDIAKYIITISPNLLYTTL
jgi:hypothetical protein